MFDESFFVALAFVTVIGALVFAGLPRRLTAALDDGAQKIANDIAEAEALLKEAQEIVADYEKRSAEALAKAEEILADAKQRANFEAEEAAHKLQEAIERRTQQAEERFARAELMLVKEIRAELTDTAMRAVEGLIAEGLGDDKAQKVIDENIAELPAHLN